MDSRYLEVFGFKNNIPTEEELDEKFLKLAIKHESNDQLLAKLTIAYEKALTIIKVPQVDRGKLTPEMIAMTAKAVIDKRPPKEYVIEANTFEGKVLNMAGSSAKIPVSRLGDGKIRVNDPLGRRKGRGLFTENYEDNPFVVQAKRQREQHRDRPLPSKPGYVPDTDPIEDSLRETLEEQERRRARELSERNKSLTERLERERVQLRSMGLLFDDDTKETETTWGDRATLERHLSNDRVRKNDLRHIAQ